MEEALEERKGKQVIMDLVEIVLMFNIFKVVVDALDAPGVGKILGVDKIMETTVVEDSNVGVGETVGGSQMEILDITIVDILTMYLVATVEREEMVDLEEVTTIKRDL
jgi:hypothetical protein